MFNPISYQKDVIAVTGNTTLGYGPNQTTPPRELVLNPTAGVTILLPPINSIFPAPPTTLQAIVGCADGFQLTIRNSTTWAVTVTPYTSTLGYGYTDTFTDTLTLNVAGAVQTIIADGLLSAWYKLAN